MGAAEPAGCQRGAPPSCRQPVSADRPAAAAAAARAAQQAAVVARHRQAVGTWRRLGQGAVPACTRLAFLRLPVVQRGAAGEQCAGSSGAKQGLQRGRRKAASKNLSSNEPIFHQQAAPTVLPATQTTTSHSLLQGGCRHAELQRRWVLSFGAGSQHRVHRPGNHGRAAARQAERHGSLAQRSARSGGGGSQSMCYVALLPVAVLRWLRSAAYGGSSRVFCASCLGSGWRLHCQLKGIHLQQTRWRGAEWQAGSGHMPVAPIVVRKQQQRAT